jgi:hypothetical protein
MKKSLRVGESESYESKGKQLSLTHDSQTLRLSDS